MATDKKKIVLIGATGTIGKAVLEALKERHNVVEIGKSHGKYQCDIASSQSIEKLFSQVGAFDALVITAGAVHFEEFQKLTEEQFLFSLHNKLMGQVNATRLALPHLSEGGSITLTSGILSRDPIFKGICASTVNSAINGFVTGAAIELPKSLRINAVSPSIVSESMDKFAPFFRGFVSVPVKKVALAYIKSVDGRQTGQIYEAI